MVCVDRMGWEFTGPTLAGAGRVQGGAKHIDPSGASVRRAQVRFGRGRRDALQGLQWCCTGIERMACKRAYTRHCARAGRGGLKPK